MEEDSPSKPSVAELAGRLKGHILPMSTTNNGLPFQRKSTSSIKNQKFQNPKDDNEESDKAKPFKIKLKSSPIIEKLQLLTRWAAMGQKGCRFSLFLFSPVQANLALSPAALLPASKNPEVKLQAAPPSAATSCRPPSPTLQPTAASSTEEEEEEEEEAAIFNHPPAGAPLPSINKTRARLSFKRRPPSRQHRRSAGEEEQVFGLALSPCEQAKPAENGEREPVLSSSAEEASVLEAGREDRDCARAREEVAKADPDHRRGLEEEREEEQAQNLAIIEEEQVSEPPQTEETGGVGNGRDEMVEEEHRADVNQM